MFFANPMILKIKKQKTTHKFGKFGGQQNANWWTTITSFQGCWWTTTTSFPKMSVQ
jgi:hypothetical protein